MTKEQIVAKLQEGEQKFIFLKKDPKNSTKLIEREARGTLNESLFTYTAKGGAAKPSSMVTYWDLDKNSFRMFNPLNFVKWI